MPLTRAQLWSHVAFTKVRGISGLKATQPDLVEKYRTSCRKMPSLIHQSGSLQALVFQVARDHAGATYVDHLAEACFAGSTVAARTHTDLILRVQDMELARYMAFTRDLADITLWFRRFADIELAE